MMTQHIAFLISLLVVAPLSAADDPDRDRAKKQARQQITGSLPRADRANARSLALSEIIDQLDGSQRAGAAEKIQKLVPLYKNNPAALGELGSALAALGRTEDAQALASQLQRSNPEHPAGFLIAAQAIGKSNPRKARDMAKRAVQLAEKTGDHKTAGLAASIYRLTRADSSVQVDDIATGSGSNKRIQNFREVEFKNERLHVNEQRAIAAATKLLNRTEIGEDNILAILPKMSVRRLEAAKDKGISSENVYVEEVNGKKVYVAVLSKQTLEADLQSLAAHFNGKMGRARFLEANDGKVSSISAKTVEMMQTVWARAQLLLAGAKSVGCSISASLCDYVGSLWQAWNNDFDDRKPKQAENQKMIKSMNKFSSTERENTATLFQTNSRKSGEGNKDMQVSFEPWYRAEQPRTRQQLMEEDRQQKARWNAR